MILSCAARNSSPGGPLDGHGFGATATTSRSSLPATASIAPTRAVPSPPFAGGEADHDRHESP